MENNINTRFTSAFEEDVYNGLTSYPKHLSSKYFYDKKGDKLFQDIMNLPEYYLTNCEYNILATNTQKIAEAFAGPNGFDLIELGAGDGKKTKLLLRYLIDKKINFDYLPVDISQNALDELEGSLKKELPTVSVKTQQGTYLKTLERLSDYNSRKKVILVLGSNIGNLLHEDAIDFLKKIQDAMSPDDMLFMGFDQKKNPQTILDAYNDPTGVTEAFNKNVLERINNELDGNFDLNSFFHWETYNPETGTAKSFLISREKQAVTINNLDLTVNFEAWESIHTEISQKYDDMIVEWLASQADLKVTDSFTDEKDFYKNYIFRKK
ncbi:L-histidine N(alpha)-methyltransferase [Gillisia sp. CAL575]|uniref:L-histidine N(alpha)-methyltransferase n=1 Tax=Gillisia sp. CAL575 TaxID=985255 RepID=UPI0003A8A9DF|nr:L-histidine N(alpha)-methyltransferase [Gillisia sp. CAL575]